MKRLVLFFILGLAYLLFSAKSCDSSEEFNAAQEQKRIKTAKDSIAAAFSTEYPSESSLRGFEQTAITRYTDFWDYIAIIEDTATAPAFRNQAKMMIRDIYISENITFRYPERGRLLKNKITLSKLLDTGTVPLNKFMDQRPDTVWVLRNLNKANDSIYSGILGFSNTKSISAKNTPQKSSAPGTIDFYIAKRYKKFGSEKLQIWTVLLGNAEFATVKN